MGMFAFTPNILVVWLLLLHSAISSEMPSSLLDLSIDELGALLHDGITTSAHLVDIYIERISEVDHVLRSIIVLNPDARQIAMELDEERSLGRVRGALHGIPILAKDTIATMDSMSNTAGSVCLNGAKVKAESTIIAKLRQAGAIILGKTNLSEWAGFRSTFDTTTLGWTAIRGQGRGAYCEHQDPAGSSSGSAVAVSVGLAAAALGSETSGSIIAPAEWNNIVGVKPTLGLISRHMVMIAAPRQDVVGPMARTVRDAAHVLSAVVGQDTNDNYTLAQPFDDSPNYAEALDVSALRGARLGVPWNAICMDIYLPGSEEHLRVIRKAFNDTLATLSELGATIVHTSIQSIEGPGASVPWEGKDSDIYLNADAIPAINRYLNNLDPSSTNITTFDDIINCTTHQPAEQYPTRDISQWEEAKKSKVDPQSPEAWEAYQRVYRQSGSDGIFRTLDEERLDALILPSMFSFELAAYAGSPVVTVPMGAFGPDVSTKWRKEDDPVMRSIVAGPNMPFGLGFFGHKWSEAKLLSLAYSYESHTQNRRKLEPWIKPTAELKSQTSLLEVQK